MANRRDLIQKHLELIVLRDKRDSGTKLSFEEKERLYDLSMQAAADAEDMGIVTRADMIEALAGRGIHA